MGKAPSKRGSRDIHRRDFLKSSLLAATAGTSTSPRDSSKEETVTVDDFNRPDTFYTGDGWESLNPGYWQIKNCALRRSVRTRGDRARATGFPFHYSTHGIDGGSMPTEYVTKPPYGMAWRRDWNLRGNFRIRIEATIRASKNDDTDRDAIFAQPGWGLLGICFGGRTLFESWHGGGEDGDTCWFAAWRDNGRFGIYDHGSDDIDRRKKTERTTPRPKAGDRVTIDLAVSGDRNNTATVTATLSFGDSKVEVQMDDVSRALHTEGYFGLTARGGLDFEVKSVRIAPGVNLPDPEPLNGLHVCYPLGQTLKTVGEHWRCRFVAVFRDNGDMAEIRVAASENPAGGWKDVPAAGRARIVTNGFRRATSVIDVQLPFNPAKTEMFYTVWRMAATSPWIPVGGPENIWDVCLASKRPTDCAA